MVDKILLVISISIRMSGVGIQGDPYTVTIFLCIASLSALLHQ
jgi:hypothetical protein